MAIALLGLSAVTALAVVGPTPTTARAEPQTLTLTWSDEFNEPAGSGPDRSKWRHDIGGSGWGNNERQYYTDSNRNAAMDGDGNLVITARRENSGNLRCHYGRCEYTSARLLTAGLFTQKYGRFEARMKLPRGQGLWPAFWMLGGMSWPDRGEIDIMENIGREPRDVHGTLHGPGYSGGGAISSRYVLPGDRAFTDEFHTFGVDWAPKSISWYVDGVTYAEKTPEDLGGAPWVFNHPFFMILNLAVGGHWPGHPDNSTQFPQRLLVDYVRVWSGHEGGTAVGDRILGYGDRCIDVPGAIAADGVQPQIWKCNGTAAQAWNMPGDGTIQALGKCMDLVDGSTTNGTDVKLATCNGSMTQQFLLNEAGDLANLRSGKCADVRDRVNADGALPQIWRRIGGANQKWRRG
ncbi:family 16 glycosylhydrolase [Micromonospora sp. NBC_00858]|uniref:family 16 glycosylhydrolase n=1 Tax=Micromonospora sp. NBC_00858 TaxID=2975979 RepID=UPI00386E27A8|nr:family 16 glycosylhydrolase [Micromonospora sp. NBC_00858]